MIFKCICIFKNSKNQNFNKFIIKRKMGVRTLRESLCAYRQLLYLCCARISTADNVKHIIKKSFFLHYQRIILLLYTNSNID